MIFGAHVIVSSKDPSADRAFLRDVFGFASVDAGHGWLIFACRRQKWRCTPLKKMTGTNYIVRLS